MNDTITKEEKKTTYNTWRKFNGKWVNITIEIPLMEGLCPEIYLDGVRGE